MKGGDTMARLGMGVRKRPDGIFEKRFTVNGKRVSVYGKTFKEIQEKEQEIRKQFEAGIYTDNRKITLDKYFEEWIQGKRVSAKGSSLKTYKNYYYKHISSRLGHRRIQQIERREILKLQREVAEIVSETTCNMVLKTLKIVLNDAVHDDIIFKNPADGVKSLKKEGNKAADTYHRALTEDEQKIFMQEAASNYYYEFLAFSLCTGMRCGEVAALTWNDIDEKENVIHITKTVTYTEDGKLTIGTPKTEASKRDIPLTEQTRSILKQHRDKYGNIIPIGCNNIFIALYGGLIHNHAINNAIKEILNGLEEKGIIIEHFTAHALRDTFATRYIEQGGNMQTLKTILGHNSLAMTMDLYSHVLPNTKQKEMDNLRIII